MTDPINEGLDHLRAGRLAAAEAACLRVSKTHPRYAEALGVLGVVYAQTARIAKAEKTLRAALRIRKSAETYMALGRVLTAQAKHRDALRCYDCAGALDPNHAEAFNNKGNALEVLKRPDDAIASYRAALALRPNYPDAHVNLGHCLRTMGRLDDAEAAYRLALECAPGYPTAVFGLALVQLARGQYEEGWRNYESRLHPENLTSPARYFEKPQWLGAQPLAGATILLHAEQGLGDTLQFVRYVAAVKSRGARVILEVQPELKPLINALAGPDVVIACGEPIPHFDLHCPLLSLPLALGTPFDPLRETCPYLACAPALRDQWRQRLGARRRLRVGLVWSGNDSHVTDHLRSPRLSQLAPVLASNADFYVLQKTVRRGDLPALRRARNVVFNRPGDFASTAALASLMDVVVSVDTAAAHLAGAMGLRVWILLRYSPDWRWGLTGDMTDWYPTARLFRQQAYDDWPGVVAALADALAKLATDSMALTGKCGA